MLRKPDQAGGKGNPPESAEMEDLAEDGRAESDGEQQNGQNSPLFKRMTMVMHVVIFFYSACFWIQTNAFPVSHKGKNGVMSSTGRGRGNVDLIVSNNPLLIDTRSCWCCVRILVIRYINCMKDTCP